MIYKKVIERKSLLERKKAFVMYLNRYFGETETLFILEKQFGKRILTASDKLYLRHGYGSWLKYTKPYIFKEAFNNWNLERLKEFKLDSRKEL